MRGGDRFAVPEASDEALREVIVAQTGCLAPGSQFFHAPFRAGCRKLAVLVTDARPGGCDDAFTLGVDDVNATQSASDAAAAGIETPRCSFRSSARTR